MDTTARAVEELDLDLPEIMLTELRGQTFKTNQRFHRLATKRSHQRIQRRLASCVACLANPSQNLQGSQLGLFLQNLYHPFPETLDPAGPADPPFGSLGQIVDLHHWTFARDALNRAQRNSRQLRHISLRVTSLEQYLYFVTLQHSQHPPPSALAVYRPRAQEEFYRFRLSPDGSEFPE